MSKNDKVKDAFFGFLQATSLGSDLDRPLHIARSYGHNCLLLGWKPKALAYAVEVLQEIAPKVSRKIIQRKLIGTMVQLFEDHNVNEDADPETDAPEIENICSTLETTAIIQAKDKLLDSLKSIIKPWTAFVFIYGLELQGITELPLGATTLYDINHGPLAQALEEQKRTSREKGYDWDYEQFVQQHTKECKCYLTIEIEGESNFADQNAFAQVQNVVSVLTFYLASCRQQDSHKNIAFTKQATVTRILLKRTPPFTSETPLTGYTFAANDFSFSSYMIDRAIVQKWEENCIDKALEYATVESQPGSAESRIRNAFTWYGHAINASSMDEQFVNLTIALEGLLVAEESDDVRIKQRLADEIASLVGTDYQNRQGIKKRIGELYKTRCNIVHKGIPASLESLYDLDDAVTATIIAFLRKETN